MEFVTAGTGLFVLGLVIWIVCAVYAWQNAPKLGRSRAIWTTLAAILGPIAVMILYVLPKKPPAGAAAQAAHGKQADPRDALYEVPKKH